MKKMVGWIGILTMLLAFTGCAKQDNIPNKTDTIAPVVSNQISTIPSIVPSSTPEVKQRDIGKYRITDVIHSEALKNNLVGEKVDRDVFVYLPPSYYDSDKKYPVLFYLHGHQESPGGYFASSTPLFDESAEAGNQEFIVVFVDGASQHGGSFYVNSVVTGNWEDYVVNEVVGYVDKNYRTIANKDSRGIFGFSMGGFGALNLAMKHPDVFGAVFSMSPGLIADGDMDLAMDSWYGDTEFKIAYGRAFSPNTKNKEDYANIPAFDGSKADNKIIAQWENGFGNINAKVKDYCSKKTKLKAIKILYGENDDYTWIPLGSKALGAALGKNGIECEVESFSGGHFIKQGVAKDEIAPFFAKYLVVK